MSVDVLKIEVQWRSTESKGQVYEKAFTESRCYFVPKVVNPPTAFYISCCALSL